MGMNWLTIDTVLQRTRGEMRGLPMLRAVLVFLIVTFQSIEVSQSFSSVAMTPLWIVPAAAYLALFAVLGFALAEARMEQRVRPYLTRRLVRAWPPLLASVLIALLLIGPLVTTRGLQDYMLDPQSVAYLLNLICWPQFRLPGVFEFNELRDVVNPVFWVVPVYATIVLVIALSPEAWRKGVWGGVAGTTLVLLGGLSIVDPRLERLAEPLVFAALMLGSLLSALLGALAQALSRYVPLDWRLAAAATLVLAGVALAGDWTWSREPVVFTILVAPVAYIAVWLSIRRAHGAPFWKRYQSLLAPLMLLAFPFQQAAISLGPRDQNAVVNLLVIAVPLAAAAFLTGRGLRHRRLLVMRYTPAWENVESLGRVGRRKISVVALVRTTALALLVGGIVVIATMLLFVLTFFALQRDGVGI